MFRSKEVILKYTVLSRELGLQGRGLTELIEAGLFPSDFQLTAEISDEAALLIRRYCLLRKLSFSVQDICDVNSRTVGFVEALSSHVADILKDKDNISQAAIVLQNIKRENEDFFSFDPCPYLDHIRELEHNGGIFYDVNTSLLPREGYTNSYGYGKPKAQNSWYVQGSDDPNAYRQDRNFGPNGTLNPGPNGINTGNSGCTTGNSESDSGYGQRPGYPYGNPYYRIEAEKPDPPGTCPRPFRRYIARLLDSTITGLIVYIICCCFLRIDLAGSALITLITLGLDVLELAIEPILISLFCTTPGKWLMGIRITKPDTGDKLTIGESYSRAIKLAWYGVGCFIPIFSWIRQFMCFKACKAKIRMPWDEGCEMKMSSTAGWRIAVTIICIVLFTATESVISYQPLIPSNRGRLTTEDFYENCAEVMKQIKFTEDMPDFIFKINGGYITSVQLKYSENDGSDVNPAEEMYIAYMAFAASSEQNNCLKMAFDLGPSLINNYGSSFKYSYCGIQVTNEIEGEEKTSAEQALLSALMNSMQYATGGQTTMQTGIAHYNQTFTLGTDLF